MGIYAPTGTDGEVLNVTEEKEGKILPFSPNRMGSSTVGNGARSWTSLEPVCSDMLKLINDKS